MNYDNSWCTTKSGASKIKKSAETFLELLKETHQGKIVIQEDAVYRGSHKKIAVHCLVCNHKWEAQAYKLINENGCAECARLRAVASAGTRRRRCGSAAEKELAKRMYQIGMTIGEIGKVLKRNSNTVRYWVNPEARKDGLRRSAEKVIRDRESGKATKMFRDYSNTEHGKETRTKSKHKRRSLKYHCNGLELVDGIWQENDLWSYVKGDKEAYALMSFEGIDKAMEYRTSDRTKYQEWFNKGYEIDHIIPLSRGGTHSPLNLKVIPQKENNSKLNKIRPQDIAEYCQRLFQTFNYF